MLFAGLATTSPLPMKFAATWGTASGAHGGTITSSAQASTVPAGNPGNVRINYSVTSGATGGTMQYRINGASGTWTNLAQAPSSNVVTVPNGQTLEFRCLTTSGIGSNTIGITDASTNTIPASVATGNPVGCVISAT